MVDGGTPAAGLKRCLRRLEAAPDRVELVLKECREAWSLITPPAGRPSIRRLVADLGTLERETFGREARHVVGTGEGASFVAPEPSPALDVSFRDLVELVARFRHFRSQSIELIAGPVASAAGAESTVSAERHGVLSSLLERWCASDERWLEAISDTLAAVRPHMARSNPD